MHLYHYWVRKAGVNKSWGRCEDFLVGCINDSENFSLVGEYNSSCPKHMKKNTNNANKGISKGAAIFQKMLEDKNAIRAHTQNGGRISDLKDLYSFVKPVPTTGA